MAEAIADHYAVSVLVHEKSAARKVSGRLICRTLDEALDSFAFLLGEKYRADASRRIFMFGGPEVSVITALPSYGLQTAEVAALSKEGVRAVADRIVIDADQAKTAELREVLTGFRDRPAITLELFLLDVGDSSVDRVNAWLDTVRVGGGYVAKSYLTAAGGAGAAPLLQSVRGPTYDVEVKGLLDLLETERGSRVELRQQVQVLSGSQSRFSSGEVFTDTLYTRQAQTDNDLTSRIERRTVGLTIQLHGTWTGEAWHFRIELEDSSFVNQRERSTKVQTERVLKPDAGFVSLASFTRKSEERTKAGVPGLSGLGKVGRKLFTKGQTNSASRSLMLLARPVR